MYFLILKENLFLIFVLPGFIAVNGQNSSDFQGSSFSQVQLNVTPSSYFLRTDGISGSVSPANEYSSTNLLLSETNTVSLSTFATTIRDVPITTGSLQASETVLLEGTNSDNSLVIPSESLTISYRSSLSYLTANLTMSSDVHETTELNAMSQAPFVTSQFSRTLDKSDVIIQSSLSQPSAITQSYVETVLSTTLDASFPTTVVFDDMKTPLSVPDLSPQYAIQSSVMSNESTHIPKYSLDTPLSYTSSFTLSSSEPYSSSFTFLSSGDHTMTTHYTTLGFLGNNAPFTTVSLTSFPTEIESQLESESEFENATSSSEASSEALFTSTSSYGSSSFSVTQALVSSKGVSGVNSTSIAGSELVSSQANISSMESAYGLLSSSSSELLSASVSSFSATRLSVFSNFSLSFTVSNDSTKTMDQDFEILSSIVSPISAMESLLNTRFSSSVSELSPSYSFLFADEMSSAVNETFIDRSSFSGVSSDLSELVTPPITSDILTQAITHNRSSSVQSSSSAVFPSPGYVSFSTASNMSAFVIATPHLVSITSNITTSSVTEIFFSHASGLLTTTLETTSEFKTSARISLEMTETIYSSPFEIPSYSITPSSVSKIYMSNSITPASKIMPDLKLIFEFEGDCDSLILNAKLQIEFWQALIAVLSIETSVHIPREHVQPEDLNCHPFQVILLLKHLNRHDYTKIVEKNISISNLGVPILDDMSVMEFEIKSVKVISMKTGYIKRPSAAKPVLEKEDIVIIVTAGVLFGFLLSVCAAIACRECYKRRRAASFNLLDVPHVNLDMEDFTLTKIPRPQMIYRENSSTAPTSSTVKAKRQGRPKSLPASDSNAAVSNGTHSVNADTIQVRIQPHPDGVVVGVTCTPPRSPTKESVSEHSSPRSDASDPSVQTLLKDKSSEFGMANPNFEADDEVKSGEDKKYIIREDEEEALL